MRKLQVVFVSLVLLVALASCAGIQEKWNQLTPDEQARVILNGLQEQLNIAFDQAKIQIGNKPEWKTKVVPAFKIANEALAKVYALAKTQSITPSSVLTAVQAQVNEALAIAQQAGWIKTKK
jgi:hypothetical protein